MKLLNYTSFSVFLLLVFLIILCYSLYTNFYKEVFFMSNRQQRRHPTHPALPLPRPSGEKVPDQKKGKPDSKGHKDKK